MSPKVAIVHDYLTQMGGAERVVLIMARAFPEASIHTSLYDPDRTYPAFRDLDVRPMETLNRIGYLRRHQRVGLPLFGRAFRNLSLDADVVLCSSSGWAHQVRTGGRKLVYCYAPARWIYEPPELFSGTTHRYERLVRLVAPVLRRADQAGAAGAERYLTSSSLIQRRILDVYGIESEILPPPPALPPEGPESPAELEPGALLMVTRLFAYKNAEVVVRAALESGRRLWVVGEGPDRRRLEQLSDGRIDFLGQVGDDRLRWLYRNCSALVAAAYEDFGLTPLEANAFGRPVAALRWGGYLDTVIEDETGVFFDRPEIDAVNAGLDRLESTEWDQDRLVEHAATFGEDRFISRLRALVGATVDR
jgi:glycosyltransferase involved in cell wall biosynthesis